MINEAVETDSPGDGPTSIDVISDGTLARTKSKKAGPVISFHSLTYEVMVPPPNRRCCGCCSKVPKQILQDISGYFQTGMNAIMGPTGSGKTSLLDVLAGRTRREGITGHILVDGNRVPKNFKCLTGYVVQDDIVMGTLTVRENLMFSANLRLSPSVSHAEKSRIVDEALQDLGIVKCADTKVGTAFIRGISGGERKRTNIGMELIISPGILFLDEPTTGLDASTAGAVMALLQRLSKAKGLTIIFSIHQPRYAIYRLFDRLSLLAAGRTIFHGKSNEALDFFQANGYECEAYNNPPDFFLDVINGDSTAVRNTIDSEEVAERQKNGSLELQLVESGRGGAPVRSLAEQLATKFADSTWSHSVQEELKPILSDYLHRHETGDDIVTRGEYATPFLTQLRYVSKRSLLNLFRNPATSIVNTAIAIFLSVIVGIIYSRLDKSCAALQSRVGCLFFLCVNQVFGNLATIEVFIHERAIFIHENVSGFYRVSSYFFAKVFCELIPMRIIPLIPFSIIIYFMIGFVEEPGHFFILFLTLLLTALCASAICFTFSALIGVFALANLASVLVFIPMMIFGGLLVNIAALGDWLRWVQYLSIIRYALNALTINELKDMPFADDNPPCTKNGSDYLVNQGIAYETAWDLWQNIMALGLIAIGIMTLAYICLRSIKKLK